MNLLKKCIAIKALLLAALIAGAGAQAAPVVGSVSNLSGHLLSRSSDGTVKILSQKSAVTQGDTLVTEKDSYARIKFIDDSEITLRPNSQLKIENFSFNAEKSGDDNAVFSLLKGGLRAITGFLGKRSRDRFSLKTPAATIGIRGTTFIAEYVEDESNKVAAYGLASTAALQGGDYLYGGNAVRSDAPMAALSGVGMLPLHLAQALPPPGSRAPGLYVQVLDGMINLSNSGGTQNFAAGQFGYTPSFQKPPVILPKNPGMQFTPPPAFNSSSSAQNTGMETNKSGTVDCEVR